MADTGTVSPLQNAAEKGDVDGDDEQVADDGGEQAEVALTKLMGIDLKLLLSVQEEPIVRNDNTATLEVER